MFAKGSLCDIIPCDQELDDLAPQLLLDPEGRTRFRNNFPNLRRLWFSFARLPPNINVLTQSALLAATDVIVPIDVGNFSLTAWPGW